MDSNVYGTAGRAEAGPQIETPGTTRSALPLVSVVITAHNYGRFLKAAVESVRSQIYRDVECIVVDDASSDGTAAILAELRRADPRLIVITNARNVGQGASCRIGFRACRGQYVVFMDADDTFAPDFLLDHIYVHLSSRIHVGFTSSDVYQTVDDRIVLSTGSALNGFLTTHDRVEQRQFRPLDRAPKGPWTYEGPDGNDLLGRVVHVPPGHTGWCWSPTSANMFRRDVLTLFADCDEFDRMRLGVDVYLCTGVSNLCGSFLIDKPLSNYRIHTSNNGSYQVQVHNLRTVHRESELSLQAIKILIEYLTRNSVEVCRRLWHTDAYVAALESLEAAVSAQGGNPTLSRCLGANRAALATALGEERLKQWMSARARR